jgi:flagellar basal-body rod protein FlgB
LFSVGGTVKTVFESIDKMEKVLSFHRDRQAVLAGNVANVDTPGYIPFDMTLERLPDAAAQGTGGASGGSLPLLRTVGNHLAGEQGAAAPEARVAYDDPGAAKGADGNAVNLERELAKIDANRVRYNTTAELVSRRLAILRYASGDGGG